MTASPNPKETRVPDRGYTRPEIPTGEYSERQAQLIAAVLTGDTDTVQRRLDEIANDDEN